MSKPKARKSTSSKISCSSYSVTQNIGGEESENAATSEWKSLVEEVDMYIKKVNELGTEIDNELKCLAYSKVHETAFRIMFLHINPESRPGVLNQTYFLTITRKMGGEGSENATREWKRLNIFIKIVDEHGTEIDNECRCLAYLKVHETDFRIKFISTDPGLQSDFLKKLVRMKRRVISL